MYWSDRKSLDFFALSAIVIFPLAGMAFELWSWVWEILILIAVFWFGIRKGLLSTSLLLAAGYFLAVLFYRTPALAQMGYLPWAGLLTLWGWESKWPRRVTVFWSLVLAGFLGALPMLGFAHGGFDSQLLQQMINATMQSYQATGMLKTAQELGVSEEQMRSALTQIMPVYLSLLPSFAAIISLLEYSIGYYFASKFIRFEQRRPLAGWRLPWYAIYGAILALICYLAGDQFGWGMLKGIGLNLMVIYVPVTLVLGTAVYIYVLRSPKVPTLVKWGLIMINLFYLYFTLMVLIMFGLFDMVMNLRKLPDTDA